jgi:hypothetical protein
VGSKCSKCSETIFILTCLFLHSVLVHLHHQPSGAAAATRGEELKLIEQSIDSAITTIVDCCWGGGSDRPFVDNRKRAAWCVYSTYHLALHNCTSYSLYLSQAIVCTTMCVYSTYHLAIVCTTMCVYSTYHLAIVCTTMCVYSTYHLAIVCAFLTVFWSVRVCVLLIDCVCAHT